MGWLGVQMFHRDDEGAPRIPKLPAALEWPLPDLFGAGGRAGGEAAASAEVTMGEKDRDDQGLCCASIPLPHDDGLDGDGLKHACDMATRVRAC